jgi:hypothetical protein
VPADLLRLSIGIEAAADLVADLDGALRASRTRPASPPRAGREVIP